MRGKRLIVTLCSFIAVALWSTAGWSGPESDPAKPRVPDAERGEARKLKSPITVTPDASPKAKSSMKARAPAQTVMARPERATEPVECC